MLRVWLVLEYLAFFSSSHYKINWGGGWRGGGVGVFFVSDIKNSAPFLLV